MKTSRKLVLMDSEPGHFSFYYWENVAICCWAQQATGESLRRLERTAAKIARLDPKASTVQIIAQGAAMPTPEARDGFVKLMRRYTDQLTCIAIVIRGGGFWASGLRAAVTGIRMVSPRQFPFRMHNSIDEVVKWLPEEHEKLTGVRIEPRLLLAALQEAEAPLEPLCTADDSSV